MDKPEKRGNLSREAAARYAQWIEDNLRARGWSLSELARQSDLMPQTVGSLLRGAPQPTVLQAAGIARAFGVSPNVIFGVLGLWGDADEEPPPPEVTRIYSALPPHARRVALGHLRLVREMQELYAAERLEEAEHAAYNRPDIADDAYRESVGWTDEEAP